MLKDPALNRTKYKNPEAMAAMMDGYVGSEATLPLFKGFDRFTSSGLSAWTNKGKITPEELRGWCAETMTHYKVPSQIDFRDDIPKSLVGKVLRRELQEADPLWIRAQKE